MRTKRFGSALAIAAATVAIAGVVSLSSSSRVQANDNERNAEERMIRKGFEIAPVPLNLRHKDRDLVGLGSYLVNAVGDCNGCHGAGPPTEFAPGGNPYFKGNQPKVVNQAAYLGGGDDFGSLIPGTPDIVSRNLTPDRTGRPEGGHTFAEFLYIMRTGADLDHLHPNCNGPSTPTCYGTDQPFNGDLLQVMPWPNFQNMSDHDLRAIYEYLSAVPCIEGPPAPSVLHNDCT